MSTVDDAIRAATAGFNFNGLLDRLRSAYVRRRAVFLNNQNSSWDATKLAGQITAEMTAIQSYLTGKDALIKGTETTTPPHLDMHAEATGYNWRGFSAASTISYYETVYRVQRTMWVPMIVWRAATVHHDKVWKSPGPPPVVQKAGLDESLDRRLRVVEQMCCNVNAFRGMQLETASRSWTVAGANGPWTDGFQCRNFEYPNLPMEPFEDVLSGMTGWSEGQGRLDYSNGTTPAHVPDDIKGSWTHQRTKAGAIWVNYKPLTGKKPSDVIQRMFNPPRDDFLKRSWLFCDMTGSALNLEALWFAGRRRFGNDNEFDALVNKLNPDGTSYVSLGPVVRPIGSHDLDILMCDDKDPVFENLDIDVNDLQVGDFVRFWSSRMFSLLANGAWGSEYSHIMSVDCEPATGSLRVGDIEFAGHGIDIKCPRRSGRPTGTTPR